MIVNKKIFDGGGGTIVLIVLFHNLIGRRVGHLISNFPFWRCDYE